jgi:RimJ/RimL family protein N-acetyltransferase
MGIKYTVGGMDEEVAAFITRHTGMEFGSTPYTAIGQIDQLGNLVGGCVIHNFTQRDCHVHVAGLGPRWCTRRFLGECFRHIFLRLGCVRCTGLVGATNERALKFDYGLGFKYEGTLRKHLANDEDCHILGMLREECRWLSVGVNHAKTRRPDVPATVLGRDARAATTGDAALERRNARGRASAGAADGRSAAT